MKYNYLFILISLVFLSCDEHSEKDYSILSKNYDEKTKENSKNFNIADSLRERIKMMSTGSVDTPLNEDDSSDSKDKSTLKIQNNNILKDPFFDNYDYANYIKILPKTYFVTVNKNNVTKNYICQYLESIDGSSPKYVFSPTNLNIIELLGRYDKENTSRNFFDLLD
ncbi:MAG: hypothetical protein WC139_10440 [Candidatus Kapaibacterium sp.]